MPGNLIRLETKLTFYSIFLLNYIFYHQNKRVNEPQCKLFPLIFSLVPPDEIVFWGWIDSICGKISLYFIKLLLSTVVMFLQHIQTLNPLLRCLALISDDRTDSYVDWRRQNRYFVLIWTTEQLWWTTEQIHNR